MRSRRTSTLGRGGQNGHAKTTTSRGAFFIFCGSLKTGCGGGLEKKRRTSKGQIGVSLMVLGYSFSFF